MAPAAQSTLPPGNPGFGQGGMGQGGMGQGGLGQGGMGPGGFGQGGFGPGTNRGQVAPTAFGTVTALGSNSVTISQQGGSTRTLTLTGSTTYTMGGARQPERPRGWRANPRPRNR